VVVVGTALFDLDPLTTMLVGMMLVVLVLAAKRRNGRLMVAGANRRNSLSVWSEMAEGVTV